MAHWQATVEVSNRFLAGHGLAGRLSLADHFPHRIAAAKLEGAGIRGRLRLAFEGLAFAGEPNLLRRTRDALRAVRDIPAAGRSTGRSIRPSAGPDTRLPEVMK
jgi:hypothetical protein